MRSTLVAFVAACLLLATGSAAIAAQDATPVSATPVADDAIELLYVQPATSSTLTPLDAVEGAETHELVLSGGTGETVFFSDRPNRVAGLIATADLVEVVNAESGDPPNATLVAQTADGKEEIVVVVLLSGAVDAATGDVTWQVALLADIDEADLAIEREPVTEITEAREYGACHLFIDDFPGIGVVDNGDDADVLHRVYVEHGGAGD